MKKRTILIICRRLSEASLLFQLKPKTQYRHIIASDDIRVQELVRQYPWVDTVCWIEQAESFYKVADDVVVILKSVNRWLESLANDRLGMPADLLFWIQQADGGMTTQRIQDLLLLIRSYLYLLSTHRVGAIVLLCDCRRWEDDVLIQTAHSRGISVHTIEQEERNEVVSQRNVHVFFKRVVRAVYAIYKFVRILLHSHRNCTARGSNQDEIVFQLCSSAENHVENIVPLMKALQKRGYRPTAVTWGATLGATKVRENGLHAEELETAIPLSSIVTAPCRALYTRRKANKRIKQFLIEYKSVPLRSLLWPSVQYFLKSELSMRYKLSQALKKYFKHHRPVAVKLWGGISLAEGFIAWRRVNGAKRPLIFEYWLGDAIEGLYSPDQVVSDLLLVAGEKHKRYSKQIGYHTDGIVMVGQARYDHLKDWKKTYSVEMSRSFLRLPSDYYIHILYDSNATFRGYLTAKEQVLVTDTLLHFAQEYPAAGLIIKPHPTHRPGMLEQIIDDYSLPNVFIIEKGMLPYHALNATDVVITKHSTVGIEAMLFERPVISVILDNEERWQLVFGDAAEYVTTTESLRALLEKLIDDAGFRSQWTRIQLKRQKHFLGEYFIERSQPSAVLAADAITARLKELCRKGDKLLNG